MRRIALLATVFAATGFLAGCGGSGYWSYLGNTFRVPFHSNPNIASGEGETYSKIRAQNVQTPAPILYESGDVWPAAPKAPPTLKDLQAQQNSEMTNGDAGYAPLQPLPELPGYEVPQQQAHSAAPLGTFPGGVVPLPQGRHRTIGGGAGELNTLDGPAGNGSIVVPNGNGTSTVIGPNGSVSTIPTPGK